MRAKEIVVIAGPNGAGRTTFAREVLPREALCDHFINADLIAAELSPVDDWRHYENSGPTPRLIASRERIASKQP